MFIKNEKKNIETGNLTSSSSRASFEGSPVTNSLTRISLFLSRLYFFFFFFFFFVFFGVMYVSHLHISRCHQLKKEAWLYPSTVAGCMAAVADFNNTSRVQDGPRLTGRNKQINSIPWRLQRDGQVTSNSSRRESIYTHISRSVASSFSSWSNFLYLH